MTLKTAPLLAVCLVAALARGSRAAALDNLLTGYALTSWNEGNGRPLGSVYASVQDKDGYLWIGTDAGLFRFDGSRFSSWDEISDTPLPATGVRALTVARDGSFWIGFADGAGARHVRDGRVVPLAAGLGSVTCLTEDVRGTIWAVSDFVLFRLDGDRWRRVELPWTKRSGVVLQAFVTRKGELWVATRWGAFTLREDTGRFEPVSSEYIWGLSEDAAGVIWTTDIVTGFRRLNAPASHASLEGAGYRLLHDRSGNLWVATFGEGLWRVTHSREGAPEIQRAALRTGLASDSVQSITEDRDGNIWVGTTGGLQRLTERALTPIEDVGFVIAVEPDDDGRLWAGTTNGVARFSRERGWQRSRPHSPSHDVRALHRDASGTLWVGTTDGLFRFVAPGLVRVPIPESLQIVAISSDPRGGLWIGDGSRLLNWDGKQLKPWTPPAAVGSGRINFSHADRTGRLWVGFAGGRLGFLDVQGSFHLIDPATPAGRAIHRTIHSVFEDKDGVVWIGGSGGLSRFDRGTLATVTKDNGLPASRVWAIVQDPRDRLWLTVDRGLIRIDRDEVARALADPLYLMRHAQYDPLDGLAGATVGIIGSTRTTDGALWFVRGGGLTMLDPGRIVDAPPVAAAPARIEAAVANERQLSPTPHASFPPGTKRLQISYTALTLSSSNKIRFRYRLDGFDTDWVEAGPRRTAFYTNLSPRDYRFRVEAQAEDGTWKASTAAWEFAIRPALYQTSWFYGLVLVTLVVGVWGTWRVRLRLIRRQFSLVLAERARLSREIHDTLLQSLVGVALQFDAIEGNLGSSSRAARDQLVRIRRQVEAYIREARQSIWNLRSPVFETRDLATALREFGKTAVADSSIRFAATLTGTTRPCPPRVENQLLRIGQEAITNALRHSQGTRIHLELKFDPDALTLRVSDDGRGFDPKCATLESGDHYGLSTMKERAEQLGGEFTIASVIGQGTTVETRVPMPHHRWAEAVTSHELI